jgi:hypothetical protein
MAAATALPLSPSVEIGEFAEQFARVPEVRVAFLRTWAFPSLLSELTKNNIPTLLFVWSDYTGPAPVTEDSLIRTVRINPSYRMRVDEFITCLTTTSISHIHDRNQCSKQIAVFFEDQEQVRQFEGMMECGILSREGSPSMHLKLKFPTPLHNDWITQTRFL